MKRWIMAGAAVAAMAAVAQGTGNREAFLKQQALAEMQRVASQMDGLQDNQEALAQRVARLERGNGGGEVAALKAEIAALKAEMAELRRLVGSVRGEVVNDLAAKLSKIQKAQTPPPPPPPKKQTYNGPVEEYEVQGGDTLSIVAEAFGTSVEKVKELNGLKNTNLRIGQKLIVPKPKDEADEAKPEAKPAKKPAKRGKRK